ncbi:MAG: hypothetical protein ACYCWW_10725, partial [Deltaproteobacteria bacterium]
MSYRATSKTLLARGPNRAPPPRQDPGAKLIEHEGVGVTRRQLITKALFGAGLLGLRALATGLPISVLADPRRAFARGPPSACNPSSLASAQYLILATSGNGDPINGNAPGVVGLSGTVSAGDPGMAGGPTSAGGDGSMAAAKLNWSGPSTQAAAAWNLLPASVLNRTSFFHHATYTLIHPDEPQVLALMGATSNNQMFCSMLSQQLAGCLGTVQPQPVVMGSTGVFYQGAPLPLLTPASLASTLTAPSGPLLQLEKIRDQDLLALNTLAAGNRAQKNFVEAYSTTQSQLRELSQSLMGQLAALRDDSPASQLAAAAILIQMNVAPVIVVQLPFG